MEEGVSNWRRRVDFAEHEAYMLLWTRRPKSTGAKLSLRGSRDLETSLVYSRLNEVFSRTLLASLPSTPNVVELMQWGDTTKGPTTCTRPSMARLGDGLEV